MNSRLLLATRNAGKDEEMRALLHGLPVEILSLRDFPDIPDVVEDGATLEENAIKKAQEVFRQTHLPTLADDTGLEVYALEMRPGVYSARFAGENVTYADNNRKLLHELAGIEIPVRRARFRCVVAFINAQGMLHTTEGICEGHIGLEVRGGGGFGYDPLFVPEGFDQSFAELPSVVKNQISHRSHALRLMKEYLSGVFPAI